MLIRRDVFGLLAFLALCFAVSAIGGAVTASSVGTWYAGLEKPSFNPPNWIFAPVWTALYAMMAVAGWRVWRVWRSPELASGAASKRSALTAFGIQLALNLAWSCLFFGARQPGLAFVEVIVFLAAIIWTALLFRRLDHVAATLFVPYIAWVTFAAVLNGFVWYLNRPLPGAM